jgi:hypothetical protein
VGSGRKDCLNDGFTKKVANVPVARPITGRPLPVSRSVVLPGKPSSDSCILFDSFYDKTQLAPV